MKKNYVMIVMCNFLYLAGFFFINLCLFEIVHTVPILNQSYISIYMVCVHICCVCKWLIKFVNNQWDTGKLCWSRYDCSCEQSGLLLNSFSKHAMLERQWSVSMAFEWSKWLIEFINYHWTLENGVGAVGIAHVSNLDCSETVFQNISYWKLSGTFSKPLK